MVKARQILDSVIPYQTDEYKQNWRLKLDSNENIYGASTNIMASIKNIDPEDISLYPHYGKLLDKLALQYHLSKENILLTNGCDEALNIIISAYLEKDEEFLSHNPTFSMPQLYAKIANGVVKTVEYDEKFVFNQEKLKKTITDNTKIIYIATPNNPTGEITKASIIEYLAKDYPETLFIIDCTYINFAQNVTFEDYIELINKLDNIVIVKSFSKDYAMAGLRLGFILAKEEIIKTLKKISSPYNVNTIAINCACNLLLDSKNFDEIKELNLKAKQMLSEGLKNAGFEPYPSEANFILCDFFDYCDFYYEKFKKNGVIVRNFAKNSPISTCLRLTIPKIGGVKYILELLKKRDILIFDLDGVVFDVSNSYMSAIKETFKYFANKEADIKEIIEIKNSGGMNCDWDATKCLLERHGFYIDPEAIVEVFQNLFYNPKVKKDNYLIDKEKLLIEKEVFEELSKKYDMVVFSGRLKEEADYSLKKFDIDKYFYYYVTNDDLPSDMLKPHPQGVLNILTHCPHNTIKYLGDSVDDIIAGNTANVETIGVISPGSNAVVMKNNFIHLGAKHIIDNIKKLTEFLGEIDNERTKSI